MLPVIMGSLICIDYASRGALPLANDIETGAARVAEAAGKALDRRLICAPVRAPAGAAQSHAKSKMTAATVVSHSGRQINAPLANALFAPSIVVLIAQNAEPKFQVF
ncbi:hypothetical protein CQ13_29735 [Bradyrhizobium retamae]|uniref:Uncharacterized protein n=1 Tax=Bradyrhizobium retamae TaxID=1300035 RepID=A0A0R3MQ01_9BRAD|nr:hypothetical protein CQ13_29735 [Bradyrhizobium retamae]